VHIILQLLVVLQQLMVIHPLVQAFYVFHSHFLKFEIKPDLSLLLEGNKEKQNLCTGLVQTN
jgi:hypothetical protein